MNSALTIKNVSVEIAGRKILKDVSLELNKGESLGIVGPNGGGKTSLIKAIMGLYKYNGEISIFGLSPEESRRQGIIGYLPQRSYFNPEFPVKAKDVVEMGFIKGFFTRKPKDYKEKIEKYISLVKMEKWGNYPYGKLSGGQQQRISIARALVSSPRILFLDEPNTGIDVVGQEDFYQLLFNLKKEFNISIILVTHDIGIITSYLDKVACLNRVLHYHGDPVCTQDTELMEKVYGKKVDRILFHKSH